VWLHGCLDSCTAGWLPARPAVPVCPPVVFACPLRACACYNIILYNDNSNTV